MNIYEIITEGLSVQPAGKMDPTYTAARGGVFLARDVGGYDRIYHMNRLMMAMALADGKSKSPVKMNSSSWSEKYNTVHPYSDEEYNMVYSAMATVPTDGEEHFKDRRSLEIDGTNKTSPYPSNLGPIKKK